jgi:hypothetical protein
MRWHTCMSPTTRSTQKNFRKQVANQVTDQVTDQVTNQVTNHNEGIVHTHLPTCIRRRMSNPSGPNRSSTTTTGFIWEFAKKPYKANPSICVSMPRYESRDLVRSRAHSPNTSSAPCNMKCTVSTSKSLELPGESNTFTNTGVFCPFIRTCVYSEYIRRFDHSKS